MADESIELSEVASPIERQEVLARLFMSYRDRLRRMLDLRFDRHLRSRVDPSDVLQQAFLQASRRLESYLRDPSLPFYMWLRFLAGQELLKVRRKYIGAQARDPRRQLSIDRGGVPSASSEAISEILVLKQSTPSSLVLRDEERKLVQNTLEGMEETDREVLVLKHFEQLSTGDVASLLGISQAAVRQRHVRAVARFRRVLKGKRGTWETREP